MVEMFNQNHINANLRDLVNLFFKGQNIKEEDIMKLYLDFSFGGLNILYNLLS